MMPGLAS